MITASRVSWLYKHVGRKKTLLIGTVIGELSLFVIYHLNADFNWVIYYLAVFMGLSSALVLSTGVNLISEVVGDQGKKGAFVFGIYSFTDKCLVGLAVYLITHTAPYKQEGELSDDDLNFIRMTVTAVPGACCLIGTLAVLFYPIP